MKSQGINTSNLPDTPGVYYFIGGGKGQTLNANSQGLTLGSRRGKILYIGKATSLRDRVKSYFAKNIRATRSPLIAKMLEEVEKVKFVETDSVLEALILEANEIKKYQPIYNTKEKDDKSYNYVILTKEDYPKVLIVRGRELKVGLWKTFGPFPHGVELNTALKIIRKIFPFRDKCTPETSKPCFNAQIGLCPGVCAGWISKQDYKKVIRHLVLFFEAKKSQLIKSLEKEMNSLAKVHKFEEADKVKRQIFALEHIQDVALIKNDLTLEARSNKLEAVYRIEAYDIAHISGKDVVGVMTVVEDGELAKSQYRKFKLHKDKNDDVKNLQEILNRRLSHDEWKFPDLIVVDGGKAQINAVKDVLRQKGLDIDVVSVVKDEKHKAREILGIKGPTLSTNLPAGKAGSQGRTLDVSILLANSEAHRFAITYHRKLRSKGFRI